jgi:hypothetical protein
MKKNKLSSAVATSLSITFEGKVLEGLISATPPDFKMMRFPTSTVKPSDEISITLTDKAPDLFDMLNRASDEMVRAKDERDKRYKSYLKVSRKIVCHAESIDAIDPERAKVLKDLISERLERIYRGLSESKLGFFGFDPAFNGGDSTVYSKPFYGSSLAAQRGVIVSPIGA